MDIIGGTFGQTATSFGNNGWLIVAMVIGFVIMAMGVADGIEKATRL